MKDGGPAYPLDGANSPTGMTMRQRYKLAAPITDQMVDALMEEYDSDDTRVLDTIALWAGRYADAMMLEDKRHEQESK